MIIEVFVIIFNGVPGELGVFLQSSVQRSRSSAIEDTLTDGFLHYCEETIIVIFLFSFQGFIS